MANADKTFGQDMKQKAPHEFGDMEEHGLVNSIPIISVAEGNARVFQFDDPVIGDGHAMGVASEIIQNVFWRAEGSFGIDDPVR